MPQFFFAVYESANVVRNQTRSRQRRSNDDATYGDEAETRAEVGRRQRAWRPRVACRADSARIERRAAMHKQRTELRIESEVGEFVDRYENGKSRNRVADIHGNPFA